MNFTPVAYYLPFTAYVPNRDVCLLPWRAFGQKVTVMMDMDSYDAAVGILSGCRRTTMVWPACDCHYQQPGNLECDCRLIAAGNQ